MKNCAFIAALLAFSVAMLGAGSGNAASANQDPTALTLVNRALAQLNGGTALSDVTVEANATYSAGSDIENGTATLEALGNEQSRVTLNLDGGQRQEVRNARTGMRTGPDEKPQAMAQQNTWTDAAWFSPGLVLASLVSNPQMTVANLGADVWNGISASHLRFARIVATPRPEGAAAIELMSREDVYFDVASGLPLAISFYRYPEPGPGAAILMEIRFSDYRQVDGRSVPMHVERFVNGSLVLDFNLTSVKFNSGISPTLFEIR